VTTKQAPPLSMREIASLKRQRVELKADDTGGEGVARQARPFDRSFPLILAPLHAPPKLDVVTNSNSQCGFQIASIVRRLDRVFPADRAIGGASQKARRPATYRTMRARASKSASPISPITSPVWPGSMGEPRRRDLGACAKGGDRRIRDRRDGLRAENPGPQPRFVLARRSNPGISSRPSANVSDADSSRPSRALCSLAI
jgi:hypothetical protein